MYCIVQVLKRKKPNPYGEYRDPDVNHDRDTTRELQLLNRLKEQWGV